MRPPRWPESLLASALALAGCGAQVTVLTASGPFEGLLPQAFEESTDQGGVILRLELAQGGTPAEVTVRLEGAQPCWRTKGNQHACTIAGDAGLVAAASVQAGGHECELLGWVERLDDTWQLDLQVGFFVPCAEGRLAAVIVR